MEPLDPPFPFTGLTGRPRGAFVRALSRVLPGVAAVQEQVEPYSAQWRRRNAAALRGEHPRWIALGDSMTQGIGASAPDRGWVGQLAERLPEPVDVINLSQSGGRVEDVLDQQIPAWRGLAPSPLGEIVTVLIGSNDVISPRYRSLLLEAFDELLGALPHGAIVATLPSPTTVATRVSARIIAAGEAGRIRVVHTDALGPGSWQGRLAADRFHPNDRGYALIADAFAPAVSEALAELGETARSGPDSPPSARGRRAA